MKQIYGMNAKFLNVVQSSVQVRLHKESRNKLNNYLIKNN